MSSSKAIVMFLLLVLSCSSCLGKMSTHEITPVLKNEKQQLYPYPVGDVNMGGDNNNGFAEEPYPITSPTESLLTNLPKSLTIPQPQKDTGIVTGFLVTVDKEPYIGAAYLAKAIPADQAGYPPLVGFSEKTDPKAIQSADGQFLFVDILSGEYAIILWNPVSSVIIKKPDSEDFLLFIVEAGKVTDLGKVRVP